MLKIAVTPKRFAHFTKTLFGAICNMLALLHPNAIPLIYLKALQKLVSLSIRLLGFAKVGTALRRNDSFLSYEKKHSSLWYRLGIL